MTARNLLANFLATLLGATAAAPLVDVQGLDHRFHIDIRYATADNFTGQVLYPVARCLIRPEVADMLKRAQAALDKDHPGYVLLFKDCYRPESVQRRMWKVVVGTPQQGYVADPNGPTGSVHNYGAAVDLTLNGPDGKELDMGTPYDFLGPLAEPRKEEAFKDAGKLTAAQLANRRILRRAMEGAGFHQLEHEWWHYDALRGEALKKKYTKLDIPLDAALASPPGASP